MSVESKGGKRWRRESSAKPRTTLLTSDSILLCVRAQRHYRRDERGPVDPRRVRRTSAPSPRRRKSRLSCTLPLRRRRTRHHPLFRHTDAHSLGDDGLASFSRCCHGDAAASGSKARYRQPMNGGGGRATLRSAAGERRGVRANVVAAAAAVVAAADRRFRDGLYGSAPI